MPSTRTNSRSAAEKRTHTTMTVRVVVGSVWHPSAATRRCPSDTRDNGAKPSKGNYHRTTHAHTTVSGTLWHDLARPMTMVKNTASPSKAHLSRWAYQAALMIAGWPSAV